MKHTKVVSKCCKADYDYRSYTTDMGIQGKYYCKECNKECDTLTITLTPDSEIANTLKLHRLGVLAMNKDNDITTEQENLLSLINSIAEQLKIKL